jgi:hypothetical protein
MPGLETVAIESAAQEDIELAEEQPSQPARMRIQAPPPSTAEDDAVPADAVKPFKHWTKERSSADVHDIAAAMETPSYNQGKAAWIKRSVTKVGLERDASQAEAKESKRNFKLASAFAAVMCVFLLLSLASNAVLTAVIVEETKETKSMDDARLVVKGSNTTVKVASADFTVDDAATLTTPTTGEIVHTAEAEAYLPLIVLPVLERRALEHLRTVTVRMYDFELYDEVEEVRCTEARAGPSHAGHRRPASPVALVARLPSPPRGRRSP